MRAHSRNIGEPRHESAKLGRLGRYNLGGCGAHITKLVSVAQVRRPSALGVPADRIGSDTDADPTRMESRASAIRIRGWAIRGLTDYPRIDM